MGLAVNILAGAAEGIMLAFIFFSPAARRRSRGRMVLMFVAFMIVSGAVAVGLSHVKADSEGIGFGFALLVGLFCGSALFQATLRQNPQIKQVRASTDLIGCRVAPMSGTNAGLLSIGFLAAFIASVALVMWLM